MTVEYRANSAFQKIYLLFAFHHAQYLEQSLNEKVATKQSAGRRVGNDWKAQLIRFCKRRFHRIKESYKNGRRDESGGLPRGKGH